jgi:hypothetical protein
VLRRSRHRLSLASVALVAAAALAGPALAEPPNPDHPKLDHSRLGSRFDAGQALKEAGVAHTSLDRSFAGHGAASVGFLCGLQPSDQTSGMGGAFGRDHDGRFLGAQLRFGFR